jgi:hypothetical protein
MTLLAGASHPFALCQTAFATTRCCGPEPLARPGRVCAYFRASVRHSFPHRFSAPHYEVQHQRPRGARQWIIDSMCLSR